ncbi:MAG: BspA family leucine-rich repeat surface protein [Bacteroidota bacterium]
MKNFLLVTLFSIYFFAGLAQNNTNPPIQGIKVFEKDIVLSALPAPHTFRLHLKLKGDHDFQLVKRELDKADNQNERFQQYYKGIEVTFGEVSLQKRKGDLVSMSYNVYPISDMDLTPALNQTQALEKAKAFVGAKTYLWEKKEEAALLDSYQGPKGELVILPNIDDAFPQVSLAYKFDIYALNPIYRAYVYVDANNGTVLMENATLHDVDVQAMGTSLFNGVVSFTADSDSGVFRLRQGKHGSGVYTFDLHNSENYNAATDIQSNTAFFGAENATGVQAHWGAENTYIYYQQKHGRDSFDNAGAPLVSYIGYGTNFRNAFWDGQRMTYGDGGDGTNPLVSLDIVGHEISHGVIQNSANLVYQKEPGALNESFADIFGESIESSTLGSNDWLLGDEIGPDGEGGAFRSLADPNSYGQPDTYGGAYWKDVNCFPSRNNDYCGVHTNSGVQNYWFYLLSIGGSGTNDIGNAYVVDRIGIEKAAAIAYRNLTVYLNSTSNHQAARQGAIQSAIDLYGAGSPEEKAVTDAWHAVGVGESYDVGTIRPFVTTWKTDNPGTSNANQITIPTNPQRDYNYSVDWGDGRTDTNITGNITHTYTLPGQYTVRISGTFPQIYFNNTSLDGYKGDEEKLLSIEKWGTNKWASMDFAFSGCKNLEVSADDFPDFSELTSFGHMFFGCRLSNDIPLLDKWDVSAILDLSGMFAHSGFDQDIAAWDVSSVTTMVEMFKNSPFDRDIGSWGVSEVKDMSLIFDNSDLTRENYDRIWIGWSNLESLQNNVKLGANHTSYCLGEDDRQDIITKYGWSVTDSGKDCSEPKPFVTTWKTDNPGVSGNRQITIPTHPEKRYDYTVLWGDGSNDTGVTGEITHTYSVPGNYTISITGKFPGIFFNGDTEIFQTRPKTGDTAKIISVDQWGSNKWSALDFAFAGCQNLDITATDVPDLSRISSTNAMFLGCSGLQGNAVMDTWDISGITSVDYMFKDALLFDRSLDGWDFSGIQQMRSLFEGAASFNQNLAGWNIANARDMSAMFNGTALSSLNYDLILLGWGQKPVLQSGVALGARSTSFCVSEKMRQYLIDILDWIIEDAGKDCSDRRPFVTTWKTNNTGASNDNQITIPVHPSSNYDYFVDWGDGTSDSDITGSITHTYDVPGTYEVLIFGNFPRIYFNASNDGPGDEEKIISVNSWGDQIWSSMENAFSGCSNLDVLAEDTPDLSGLSSLEAMFMGCISLMGNEAIGSWDMANVVHMGNMFQGAVSFNQDIAAWDVGKVTQMDAVFADAESFNQDISTWNMASVQSLNTMFSGAVSFNQDLSPWDTGNVTRMISVFEGALDFDQDLSVWNIGKVTNMNSIFNGSGLSSYNYDMILMGWSQEPIVQNNVQLGASTTEFCIGEKARQLLIDSFGWTIDDAGKNCSGQRPFVTVWKTDNPGLSNNDQITLPAHSEVGYDYIVDWGDGTSNIGVTDAMTHTYETRGTFEVSIYGDFPKIYFNGPEEGPGDHEKIVSVLQWGDQTWSSMENAFAGCTNLDVLADDVPDLSHVDILKGMFRFCSSLVANEKIGLWDVSTVSAMDYIFEGAVAFDQNIGDWDMGNVTSTEAMFKDATSFNQAIGNWNMGKVTNTALMFNNALSFDQGIGHWDVGSVLDMDDMFTNVKLSIANYDQLLIGWGALADVQPGIELQILEAQFCLGEVARQKLVTDFSWSIIDGGASLNCGDAEDFVLRINAGGSAETAYNDATYLPDAYFTEGATLSIARAGLEELHQSFRFGRDKVMAYKIPVPDGEYEVNLHFSELWFGTPAGGPGEIGSRIFDVRIEGLLVEDNLDVIARAGLGNLFVTTYKVTVNDGILDINLSSLEEDGGLHHPLINAIEVLGANVLNTNRLENTNREDNNSFRIYPNPASELARVIFDKPIHLLALRVFDLSGKMIRDYQSEDIRDGNVYIVDVDGYRTGLYSLSIYDDQGNTYTKQFIVEQQ